MTLIIPKPTGAKLTLRKSWQPMDPDAAAYITAVETADAQALEERVKIAIDNFVLGCKQDGIWGAIKASCILAGARTLNGALVPLVGAAPTNFNFVSGDYNRKIGLVGNGTSKYLNSNRAGNAEPENNIHHAMYVTALGTTSTRMGHNPGSSPGPDSDMLLITSVAGVLTRCRTTALFTVNASSSVQSFLGINRNASNSYTARQSGQNTTISETSNGSSVLTTYIFANNTDSNVAANFSDGRLAFYSIGESLNLALLDARVTDLINAIGAAIP